MKRIYRALLSLSLSLTLALGLGSGVLCAAAEPDGTDLPFSGYLITLRPAGEGAFFSLLGEDEVPEGLDELDGRNRIYKAADLADVRELVYAGLVLRAEPDYQVELFGSVTATPNDPLFNSLERQYNLKGHDAYGISAQAAWDAGLSGRGVTVAVIDSGVTPTHLDGPVNLLPGRYYYYREYDPTSPTDVANKKNFKYTFDGHVDEDGNPIKYGYFSSSDVQDDNPQSHGTAVSGIIAARSDNNLGMAGIASNVTILPVKVFTTQEGHLSGLTSTMISALNYAVEHGADVINMSWGLTGSNAADDFPTLRDAINSAAAAGCILVAAVGNDGLSSYCYPAAYDNVIGVGSTGKTGQRCSFSRRNDSVWVCAPGELIYSLSRDTNQSVNHGINGTSFSCPQVSAAAALLLEADPTMTHDDFAQLLAATSTPVKHANGEKVPYTGCGIMDLQALLDAAGAQVLNITAATGSVEVQACFHPASSAALADESYLLLVAGYNSLGHLVASSAQTAQRSDYGGYQSTVTFPGRDVATVRAFLLENDATLQTCLPPTEQQVP